MENLDFRQLCEEVEAELQLPEEEKEAMQASSIPPKEEERELEAIDLDKVALDIVNSSSLIKLRLWIRYCMKIPSTLTRRDKQFARK